MLSVFHPDPYEQLATVFKALADPTRLRILGLIAVSPHTGKGLAAALQVTAPVISHHMERLVNTGIVSVRRDGQLRWYALDERALAAVSALVATKSGSVSQQAVSSDDPEQRNRQEIVRRFFDGDRLVQIPSGRKKRVIVLQHLLGRFDPAMEYDEREVNTILREVHEDVATLRRELVDYGFVTRAGGVYRVARALPVRSVQVEQEITGDEHAWLLRLISGSLPTTKPGT